MDCGSDTLPYDGDEVAAAFVAAECRAPDPTLERAEPEPTQRVEMQVRPVEEKPSESVQELLTAPTLVLPGLPEVASPADEPVIQPPAPQDAEAKDSLKVPETAAKDSVDVPETSANFSVLDFQAGCTVKPFKGDVTETIAIACAH